MKAIATRSRYQGMLQIIGFNWPWYAGGLASLLAICWVIRHLPLPLWLTATTFLGSVCALGWMAFSIIASHWVYDCSPLRHWDWIAGCLPAPKHAVGIHAGFDESGVHLARIFPNAHLTFWDVYRPDVMTEGSIARARKLGGNPIPAIAVDLNRLPQPDRSLDAVFLIFAAHEIRCAAAREAFFKELHRILKPGGTVLLVEHVRDWRNFLAYGPGAFHFLPLKEWTRVIDLSGLRVTRRFAITPFVNVMLLRKGGGYE